MTIFTWNIISLPRQCLGSQKFSWVYLVTQLPCCHHHHHHLSFDREGRWGTTENFATSFLRNGMVACFYYMVSDGQSAIWRSPSLSKSTTWPLSSSWNPSAQLALFFELWRYPPSDAVLTSAISPVTGRLVEGGSVLFLPAQVQRTRPLLPCCACRQSRYFYNQVTEALLRSK